MIRKLVPTFAAAAILAAGCSLIYPFGKINSRAMKAPILNGAEIASRNAWIDPARLPELPFLQYSVAVLRPYRANVLADGSRHPASAAPYEPFPMAAILGRRSRHVAERGRKRCQKPRDASSAVRPATQRRPVVGPGTGADLPVDARRTEALVKEAILSIINWRRVFPGFHFGAN